jgi:protein-S-isoprenylcysteine O-methyltransferase Ste14
MFFYISWLATEFYVLIVTRTRRGGGHISDRGSLTALWVTIVCSMSLGGYFQDAHSSSAFHNAEWLKPVALAVLMVGLAIRWAAIYSLGRSFSANVAIHATQKLNRSGLFHYVRHPSYSGLLLLFLAVGLRTRNWLSLLLMTVPPIIALLYRIRVEEDALIAAFGDDYLDYIRTTPRLIPGIF